MVEWGFRDQVIITGSGDQTVGVWDVKTLRHMFRLQGHSMSVKCVTPSPSNPNLIASGSRDGQCILWDIRNHDSKVLEQIHAPPNTGRKRRRTLLDTIRSPSSSRSVTCVEFTGVEHEILTAGAVDG